MTSAADPWIDDFEVIKAKKRGSEYIILCHLRSNTVTPWATWQSTTVDGKERYWGHYFYDEAPAHADFEAR